MTRAHSRQSLCGRDDLHEAVNQQVLQLVERRLDAYLRLLDAQLHHQQRLLQELQLVKLFAEVVSSLRFQNITELIDRKSSIQAFQ